MNLFLLSKHFTDTVNTKLLEVLGKDSADIKILFSSNAADRDKTIDREPQYVTDSRSELESFGYKITDIDFREYEGRSKDLIAEMRKFDAIYFTGGMFAYLLELFYKLDIIREYKKLVKDGLVHIGFSAGGMICSDNMKYYNKLFAAEYSGMFYEKGLGLFEHYIIPHYADKPKYTKVFEDAVKLFKDEGVQFIPLTHQQGVYVNNESWEII